MRSQVTTRRCELSPADEREIQRQVQRLERRLVHVDSDLVYLTVVIEHDARRNEYGGTFRLALFNRVLRAKRNVAPTIEALLKRAFDDLDEQLARFKSKLRRDYTHERKRLSVPPDAVRALEYDVLQDRELLDRALAGDREAFNTLVDRELPVLSRAIARALAEHGREPSPAEIEQLMADVLVIGSRELATKPARWSLGGWLAWLARREIRRQAGQLAVAQSLEPVAD